ncbi:hypothetical protein ERX27_02405 [Macrococcus brunensis]|uniref:Phage capsid protein n=1 Tax=Macrococcus brunensis TaxID=198483 RepID=A0A4R6BFQ8_9STAP|nr:DUF6366 family protein [Macrococcus brunensis]TDL98649.1 hypothetical protein ERX27_02405 [Macrococcus brunensis]ULG73689.1 DUF6366 family protein [Macrococcus brunensis]
MRPEEERERLRQEELKRNVAGNTFNDAQHGLNDLTGSVSTKMMGMGIVFLLLLILAGWLIFGH